MYWFAFVSTTQPQQLQMFKVKGYSDFKQKQLDRLLTWYVLHFYIYYAQLDKHDVGKKFIKSIFSFFIHELYDQYYTKI